MIPRARFCEWGSGIGVVTAMAEMLGFEACGIEIDAPLAAASRELLRDFKLSAPIETGDYLEQIKTRVEQVNGMNMTIAAATEEQTILKVENQANE